MKKIKLPEVFDFDKEKKTKLKRLLPSFIVSAAILIVVFLTVFHATDGFTNIIDTEPASIVTERDHMAFEAYVLREEKAIFPERYSGGVLYIKDDGSRVNPGDLLAQVYKNKVDEKYIAELKTIDRYISLLEKSIGDGVFTLDEKNIRDSIASIYYEMTRAIANGNSAIVSAGADDLLVLLNKMKMFAGDSNKLLSTLDEYKERRDALKSKYSGDYEAIDTEIGGYYFHNTDGYESVYTSSGVDEITYDSFMDMIKREPEKLNNTAGKLMLDYRWYMVIPTVKGISSTYSVGSDYNVTLPDIGNRTISMKLHRIVDDSTGARSLMIFSCGVIDSDLSCLRACRVSITQRDISGYRIPVSAVCEVSGNTGVYITKDGMASFRKIVILYEGDGYYIVSADNSNSGEYFIYLEPNDNIIIDSKNMYEGKVIGG